MKCHEILERLPEYQDGALADTEQVQVREHLGTCVGCRRESELQRETWRMLDDWESYELAGDLTEAIMERVAAEGKNRVVPLGSRWRFRPSLPLVGRLVAAAAAVVLVCFLMLPNSPSVRKDGPVLDDVVSSWDTGRNVVVIDHMPTYVAIGLESGVPSVLFEPGDPRRRGTDDDILEEIMSDQNG